MERGQDSVLPKATQPPVSVAIQASKVLFLHLKKRIFNLQRQEFIHAVCVCVCVGGCRLCFQLFLFCFVSRSSGAIKISINDVILPSKELVILNRHNHNDCT